MVELRFIAALLLTLSANVWGQTEPVINMAVSRDSLGVGELLNLQLVSDEPLEGGKHWQWPQLTAGDTLSKGWEIISVSEVDSSASPALEAGLRRMQNVAVMAWDTGAMVLSPIALMDSGEVAAQTATATVRVALVPLEANAAPKPMQGFKAYQFSWWERFQSFIPWIVGVTVAFVLGRWLYRKWRSRETQEVGTAPPDVPEVPAHVTALALLRQLEQDQPWNAGQGKEAQAVLSEAVRIHLQGSFGVKALERTTDELAQTLRSAPIAGLAQADSDWMVALLQRSDMVKFAKQGMDGDAHLRVVRESIAWISRTIPGDTSDSQGKPTPPTLSANGHA